MQQLLAQLSELNIKIELRDDKLQVNAPAGALTSALQQQLRTHKEALVEMLRQARQPGDSAALAQIVPDPAQRHAPFPLNGVQHAYWIGRQSYFELGNVSSHIYFEVDAEALDLDRLSLAFDRVIAHHDMLRAVVEKDGRQRVLEQVPPYVIARADLRGCDAVGQEAALAACRERLSARHIDCGSWPSFVIEAAVLDEGRVRLYLSWDFIFMDVWSLILIFGQWRHFYEEPGHALEPLALTFRDYVLAEEALKGSPSHMRAREYWWERLDGLPEAPQLPMAGPIEIGKRYAFNRRRAGLPAAQWITLKARAGRAGLTLSALLMAAFAEVLNRWSKSPHYLLNLTLFNRQPMHPDVAALVGDFTNLMLLEVDGRHDDSFIGRARRLQSQFLQDFEHREVSAVEVLRELARRRNLQQQAILPVVFTSTLMLDGRIQPIGGLDSFGPMVWGTSQTPQVWLDYQIFEDHGSLVFNWDSVDELLAPGVLDDMFAAHCALLGRLADDDAAWDSADPVRLPPAQEAAWRAYNDSGRGEPAHLLHEDVVAAALRAPYRTAVQGADATLSYGQLLAQADLVAGKLVARGVRPNELVAVVMEKGWQQVVAVLAILLSGAAYLPVDPRWPQRRRDQVLEQAEVRIALTSSAGIDLPAGVEEYPVRAAAELPLLQAAPLQRQGLDDLAYVIFTSGSTGTPKGVMIDHGAAYNTVLHMNRLFGIGPEDKVLAVSELGFDLSVFDIFGLLAAGGALVMPAPAQTPDPASWRSLIASAGVTVWNSAPQLMSLLVDHCEAVGPAALEPLRLVLMSGDWIPTRLPERIRPLAPAVELVSLGGATEGSIWSIYHPIGAVDPAWNSIPYGRPLPNQTMHVLDKQLRDRPLSVTGEIHIGGAGVARGYWKDLERNAQKFITHPISGARLYATGDLGRLMPDGNIEFLGREDSQVKLRGYRVELGEINAHLQSCAGVQDAMVHLHRRDERASLDAYVVLSREPGNPLCEPLGTAAADLSAHLSEAAAASAASADAGALRDFHSFWLDAERACLQSMLETVMETGLAGSAAPALMLERLVADGRVQAGYHRLLERWMVQLQERGWLVAAPDGGWLPGLQDSVPLAELLARLEARWSGDAGVRGFLAHLLDSLRRQADLLAGRADPLHLLFPEGTWDRAEALYQSNPVVHQHNRTLAALVRGYVQAQRPGGLLRILEVGAGTGGSTTAVLAALPTETADYLYTDVSPYFFAKAAQKFAAYPFLTFQVLDIDAAITGLEPHSFDLVIGGNVLHNARALGASLARLRGLLKPGGQLLMLEASANTPWQLATVAYLEGGDRVQEERTVADGLALSCADWRRVLERSGFGPLQFFPAVDADAPWLEAMPQRVIAAQAPLQAWSFRPERLGAHMKELVPQYMVPQRYIVLEHIPLTPNGKVDFAALQHDVAPAVGERKVLVPATALEQQLLAVWQALLGAETLSVDDNFFGVGGDSLLLTEMQRRLHQALGRDILIAVLFAHPTVRALAAHLAESAQPKPAPRAAPPPAAPSAQSRDIAVIGMAGRFPDATDVDEFWENLVRGHCSVRHFTDQELLSAGVDLADLAQPNYVKAGLVLEGMDQFDAAYFAVPPSEAEIMDPQQRFLLEGAVQALEHAGYPDERDAGRIGVFAGKGRLQYMADRVLTRPDIVRKHGIVAILHAHEKDHAATYLSYKLNLTGPSLSVNTSCSTSLVAIHMACQSLLNGECELALAGGVGFVTTLERTGHLYQEGQIASADGYCRAFADDASGVVFGSGVGLVVLKPLAVALSDRDTIHAVIRGSAINNDGADRKAGYMAPSMHGQAAVIAAAYARAGVTPQSVQYVEAHGTGTSLGDSVEFGALHMAFGQRGTTGAVVGLGSVKTNIGHLDAAAGVAGLIKVVQGLRYGLLPPTLHAATPNRQIDLANSPFYLQTGLRAWDTRDGAPRRASVSSFGVGGTNAHAVLEQAPPQPTAPASGRHQLLPFSAKTPGALRRRAEALAAHLDSHPDEALDDVAYTLQVGRQSHRYRGFVVAGGDAVQLLRQQAGWYQADRHQPQGRDVAFLLPGQGMADPAAVLAQHHAHPAFRRAFDECAELVATYAGIDLLEVLRDGPGAHSTVLVAQPLLFASEYALAQWWRSVGVRPAALLGHSLGEYVAACLAGVFSLEEALSLVIVRGQLMEGLELGRMLAVSIPASQLALLARDTGCCLAADNGAGQCVASGTPDAITALTGLLGRMGVPCRELAAERAFHSSMMEPVMGIFEECVAHVQRNRPAIPFLSSVTGDWITEEEATSPAYWARHLRATVQFGAGLARLAGRDDCLLLEVGPGKVLSGLARAAGIDPARCVASLEFGAVEGGGTALLEAAGRIWAHGADLSWEGLHPARPARRLPLPTYPFERQRYWLDAIDAPASAVQASACTVMAGRPLRDLPYPYVAPAHEVEHALVALWRDVLGMEEIGVRDNFFDLGGDSLMAMRLLPRMREQFGVEVPVQKIFDLATIRRLYLFILASREPDAIHALSEDDLAELLDAMEA